MGHTVGLGSVLVLLWAILSGHSGTLLIVLGIVSCALVLAISLRMDVVDHELHPAHRLFRRALSVYWAWLIVEIVKANIDVMRCILDPRRAINPSVIRVKATQKTDVGRVTYANSITLTPGTVCVDIDGDTLEVHALTRAAADALRTGEMDRRVTRLEGDE